MHLLHKEIASNSSHHAPISGLMLNRDSWLGVIRRVGMVVSKGLLICSVLEGMKSPK
jgi:hypothetical protein